MWRKVVVLTAALSAMVATLADPPPTSADTARYNDGSDSPGPLDIKWISHGHSGDQLEHRIATFEGWDSEDLRGKAGIGMIINVHSDDPSPPPDSGGQFIDVCIGLSFGKRGLRSKASDCENDTGVIGPVTVLHPKRRLVIFRFPDSYLTDPGPYEWGAQTVYAAERGACSDDHCTDFAPGDASLDLFAEHPR